MNKEQRDKAVLDFHKHEGFMVMIAGLKCGGVALNLTCANRCISMDLWWNCKSTAPIQTEIASLCLYRFRGTASVWSYFPHWPGKGDTFRETRSQKDS
jgi:hypothetical protein